MKKEIPKNKNSDKIKILSFNQQQRIKILSLKQMFPRLPKVLAQVKGGNTSENLRNGIS